MADQTPGLVDDDYGTLPATRADPPTNAGDAPPSGRAPNPGSLAGALGRLGVSRYSGVILLAIFIVVFSVWLPHSFPTSTTVKSILSTGGVTAILSLAVVFPLAAGAFDLSAAANLGLSALVCGSLMADSPHMTPLLAIVIAVAMACAIGVVNGILVVVVGVNSFIATLGMSSVLTAFLGLVDAGQYAGPFPASFNHITSPTPLGIPIVTFYVLALALVAWYVLEHTPPGRRLYSTGLNPDAARLAGVKTRVYLFSSFVVCGFGAGIAGIMLAASTGSVNETSGTPYLLPAYAAAFLATTQIKPGRFNVWGTILAVVLLGTGVEGLQLAGGQVWVTDLFDGVALIGAVSLSVILQRRRGRKEKARNAAA